MGWGCFVCLGPVQETCNIKMNLLATAVIQPRISWFHFPFPVDFGSELRGIFLLLEFRFTLRLLGKDKDPGSSNWILWVPCWSLGTSEDFVYCPGANCRMAETVCYMQFDVSEIPDNQHSILSALSFENHSQTRYPGSHFLYLPHLCYWNQYYFYRFLSSIEWHS